MPLTQMTARRLAGRRVLIRADFNVPLADGKITSTRRIEATLRTIRSAVEAGARVMVMSHFGRPEEGHPDAKFSLAPMAEYLGRALGREVKLIPDYLQRPPALADGQVVVLENVRFNVGEKADDPQLARQYAGLCEVFVMDAFGTAHRTQASTHGVARYAPEVCAGPLLLEELDALGKALEAPRRPLLAIVGGAKVSSKLAVLESLVAQVDQLIPGGGIANTFLKADGHAIGNSLHEPNLIGAARDLLSAAKKRGSPIPLPDDVVTAKTFSADADADIKALHQLTGDDMILDIGPDTACRYAQLIHSAGTILWNGPLGAFEFQRFAHGTETISRAIAESAAYSVAGGGDTIAAIEQFNLTEKISCITTGGGAFLELLKGKTLPAVAALEARG